MAWIQSFLDRSGKKQKDLAEALDIPASRVSEMARGHRQLQQAEYQKAAEFFGVSYERIVALAAGRPDPGDDAPRPLALPAPTAPIETSGPSAPPAATAVEFIPPPGPGERPDVPVWASAAAGDDGAMILTSGPIDFIRRSERMQDVKAPFAFYVIGNSLRPAIRHGDQVVINPGIPPRPGDDCVFIHDTEDGAMLALVKTLVRSTAEAWHVEQYDPAKTFTLSRKKWTRVLRVSEVRRG